MTPQVCEYILKMLCIIFKHIRVLRKERLVQIVYITVQKVSFFNIISDNIVAFITIVTKTTNMPWFCTNNCFNN